MHQDLAARCLCTYCEMKFFCVREEYFFVISVDYFFSAGL